MRVGVVVSRIGRARLILWGSRRILSEISARGFRFSVHRNLLILLSMLFYPRFDASSVMHASPARRADRGNESRDVWVTVLSSARSSLNERDSVSIVVAIVVSIVNAASRSACPTRDPATR